MSSATLSRFPIPHSLTCISSSHPTSSVAVSTGKPTSSNPTEPFFSRSSYFPSPLLRDIYRGSTTPLAAMFWPRIPYLRNGGKGDICTYLIAVIYTMISFFLKVITRPRVEVLGWYICAAHFIQPGLSIVFMVISHSLLLIINFVLPWLSVRRSSNHALEHAFLVGDALAEHTDKSRSNMAFCNRRIGRGHVPSARL